MLGQSYDLTIGHIYDTSGDSILNKTYTFSPTGTAKDKLPTDQQQAIGQNQPVQDQGLADQPTFDGTSTLVDYGLTNNQLNALLQTFPKFAPKGKSFVVDTNTVQVLPHNINSPSDTMTFNVSIDGTTYFAQVTYANLTDIRLVISSGSRQVYDSGTVTYTGQ